MAGGGGGAGGAWDVETNPNAGRCWCSVGRGSCTTRRLWPGPSAIEVKDFFNGGGRGAVEERHKEGTERAWKRRECWSFDGITYGVRGIGRREGPLPKGKQTAAWLHVCS